MNQGNMVTRTQSVWVRIDRQIFERMRISQCWRLYTVWNARDVRGCVPRNLLALSRIVRARRQL